jgi:hypothetical protein
MPWSSTERRPLNRSAGSTFKQVYQKNTAGFCGIAAINQVLNPLGTSFTQAFKQFAVANWTKDLVGVPDGSYNFVDEDEADSPAPYGPVLTSTGGPIKPGTPASWSDEYISRYGLSYYAVDVDAACPVVSASFHRAGTGPAFYHIITQDGSTFKTHVRGSGTDWTQAFLNDGITRAVGIVGSLDNSSEVDVNFECAEPILDFKLPNSVAVARVQPGTKLLAQVQVTDGTPEGPLVAGLTNSDFVARVGGADAKVTGGGFIQEQYWLLIEAPDLPEDTYDPEISLLAPGGSSPVASGVSAKSVVYTVDKIDQVLVIDRSGSMGWGDTPRLPAAKDAASFYFDVTRVGDGLAVVPYHTNVEPAPFDMAAVDSSVRAEAKKYINALTPGNSTSIGAGLAEAVSQRNDSPTGNPLCSFVLLSDGMENTPPYWANVKDDVIKTGCPVNTIAFGPESDELLMQDIASATGGLYYYNDVYVSATEAGAAPAAITPADVALELGNTYEYAEGRSEGRQRLLAEKGAVSEKDPEASHVVLVDDSVSEAIFALDWYPDAGAGVEMILTDPAGKLWLEEYTFFDPQNGHLGWRIRNPMAGNWQMLVRRLSGELPVRYQVLVSGRSKLTLELLLPDRLLRRFATGNRVPIYAILSGRGPISGALVEAWVTAPNGWVTYLRLFDDGEHGDGAAADGLYAGLYTRVNQAEAVPPQGEDQQIAPHSEGAYRVLARATHEKFRREAQGAFAVPAGPDENGNRLPDPFEEEYRVSDPGADPDLDGLSNYEEYRAGTDPNDPDTDGGGENDGSEVSHGREPLDPADDAIARPDFFEASALKGAVLLRYDHKPLNGGSGSAFSWMRLFRRLAPSDPWSPYALIEPTGIYTDTRVTNGQTYFYRLVGVANPPVIGAQEGEVIAAEPITSTVLSSEPVTPSSDPFPPEALVIINGGAHTTLDPDVTLTFAPYEGEGNEAVERFEDIEEMMISNDPTFAGASWRGFVQGVPWRLAAQRGEVARVYARFRDTAGNESVAPEIGMILYPYGSYLPLVIRNSP